MKREILFKYFTGDASVDEEKQIQNWVELSEANFMTFMKERNVYDNLLMTDGTSMSIKPNIFKLSSWVKSVAASIGLFILGALVYYLISDYRSITGMNTIKVPKGQYVEVFLADSTKVWLNANSELKYPSDFSDSKRIVFLDGEGYFEVKSDSDNPFFVKTEMGDVEVTGTVFNVKSNTQFSVFEVSLFEGGVNILRENRFISKLMPEQKITFIDNKYVISDIDRYEPYLWREGILAFKNESIQNVFQRFAEAFDVDIKVNPKYDFKNSFTGKFRQSDGLDYSFRLLQKSIPFKYDYNLETNTIYIE